MESTFASRVLEFRRYKGLSQKAFAERCDLEQGNITQMEKGTEPKQSNVSKLLAGFSDLNPDWLLMGNGTMLRDGQALNPAAMIAVTLDKEGVVTSSARPDVIPIGSIKGADGRYVLPGLTSGPATVAEAENILLRQQIADKEKQLIEKEKLIDRLWAMLPAKLGKMLSSSDAAGSWFPPLAPLASTYAFSR